MACSSVNVEDDERTNEKLYSDSYFRLLRLRNNTPEAADEFRELIRETEIHCSFLNMNEKSTDDLKFQFILEYSSIIDNQEQEGLLPVIAEDINKESWFPSQSKNNNYSELLKARQRSMELLKKRLNSYETASLGVTKLSAIESLNCQDKLNLHSIPEHSKLKKHELFINRDSKRFSAYTSNTSGKIPAHHKQSPEMYAENTLKRRAIETNDYNSRFSKRQNNRSNYKQNDAQVPNNTLKNSFIPASSMYKNPLKKTCENKEKELENTNFDENPGSELKNNPLLKNFDAKIVDVILSEIMDFSPDVKWSDIAGLDFVKSTVQEIVIWPLLRPDIFTGLRAPPRGILLFGPPGTGKTLIGKCIATESNSTFFCISASSLASKWVGESEQLVRALFAVATLHQPAVIFIDEIDSLLSQRSDQEQDHTRKLKTEFLVQFDGAKTNSERRVLVVGATNRPHELDEAARRRFVKRLYVPLPEETARLQIIEKLLTAHQHGLSRSDFKKICEETKGYSGSDVAHLCKEAAMGPIRSIGPEQIKTVSLDQVRPIEITDFLDALKQVRASVAQEDLNYYLDWNKKFGSFAI